MLELVFAVCLIDQPQHCKDVHHTFEGETVTASQCVMNGQFAMAQWSAEHPNWRIAKWSCVVAGQVAKT